MTDPVPPETLTPAVGLVKFPKDNGVCFELKVVQSAAVSPPGLAPVAAGRVMTLDGEIARPVDGDPTVTFAGGVSAKASDANNAVKSMIICFICILIFIMERWSQKVLVMSTAQLSSELNGLDSLDWLFIAPNHEVLR